MGYSRSSRTRKIHLLAALYVSQGLPIGFFSVALPVTLRASGWTLAEIGYIHLLALPWALKFLWAPQVDQVNSRKTLLVALQLAAACMALLMAFMSIRKGGPCFWLAMLVFNLILATQDIATDGMAVHVLNERDRGMGNAVQVGGYRLGMVLGGGGLLWLSFAIGPRAMFPIMAAMLVLVLVPVLATPELEGRQKPTPPTQPPVAGSARWRWVERLLSPGMLAIAALVFAYRFGSHLSTSLAKPFLIDQGFSVEDVAIMRGFCGAIAALIGALLGGWLMFHVSRRFALLVGGMLQAMVLLAYVLAAMGIGGTALIWGVTIAEGFFGALASVALFSLMMDAADPEHACTDYTLLACLVNLTDSMAGVVAGVTADQLGYLFSFLLGDVLAFSGCLVLVMWLDLRPPHARVKAIWRTC